MSRWLKRAAGLALCALVVVVASVGWPYAAASRHILRERDPALQAPLAIVFGASVLPSKTPSTILRDRVVVAVQLLQEGTVSKLILSGDGRQSHYNEPAAMRRLALDLGADDDKLLIDEGGARTYDSCLRARDQFAAARVILVTQGFHLPRAIHICRALGLNAYGKAADLSSYDDLWRFWLREWGAWLLALVDVGP